VNIVDVAKSDTGGQSYKMATLINRHTPHHSESFVWAKNYLNFPIMNQHANQFPEHIHAYWANADIIHIHNKWLYLSGWPSSNTKAIRIIHQHGRKPNFSPKQLREIDKVKRSYRIVSTIPLLYWVGGDASRWMPTPIDINMFDKFQKANDNIIRVVHSPTNREIKGTEIFIKVMARITQKYPHVRMVLIEKKTNAQCLAIKAICDICFDQFLGFGTSGLESMAFNQPVICGDSPDRLRAFGKVLGKLPFIPANQDTLFETIERLVLDRGLRAKYGQIGRNHVEKWHDFPKVANRIINIYNTASEVLS
jgi:glycosyltransferase involved in cell wall biosynthesis